MDAWRTPLSLLVCELDAALRRRQGRIRPQCPSLKCWPRSGRQAAGVFVKSAVGGFPRWDGTYMYGNSGHSEDPPHAMRVIIYELGFNWRSTGLLAIASVFIDGVPHRETSNWNHQQMILPI